MFEASGAEYGDERRAAVALPPQVIGSIETAFGYGTVTRGSSIAVQAIAGDAVFRGDVIETAPHGRIGIRFIDGTAFKISRGTRVVLSEFPRDSSGTLHLALLAAKGTSAFTAGQAAKTGSLGIDTPAGRIRGRAHAGRFGLLSLLALIFPMLKEVQAADSNVTLLDDDNITYKDREHGSFELITKEPIPRHIIVEDPGETVVVRRIGSSVSVNPVGNTAARMEELQVAQQDVLANWDKGLGHRGSSAPPFSNPDLELQPINFIQGDTPAPGGSLAPIQATFIPPLDLFILPPPPPTVAITSIAGQIGIAADDIINAAEADAGVQITGQTSGVANGRIVTVTIVDSSNHIVYSGTATVTNNTWSINLDPTNTKALADGIYTLTAETTNAVGDPAEATRTIRVDETPPTIAIDTIVSNHVNNVVNVNAASTGFVIAGTTTDAENGQPVTVKIVDSSGQVVDTFTTTLTNNNWSVNVSSTEAKLLHDGSYTVTADVSDSAGNPAPEATQSITVDETLPKVTWSPQAESGVEGTTIALGAITATVSSLPGHSDNVQSLVVSGIPVGAVLTDGRNCFVATSSNTSVDVESWNLSNLKITPPNDTNFILTVTATDQDANTASASELVTVAPLAPCLHPVAAHGDEDTAIALDLGVMAKSLSGANGDATPNSLDTLVVSDIPEGATLSDGTGLPGHSFTATADDASHDVASWSLSSLKITPPAEFEGCFKLTIAATERDSEGDISTTVTATEFVTVAPVAEPPTARAPATLTLNEDDVCAKVCGVIVGPLAEDNDDTVSATLTVSHGTLHVASLSGVTVTGNDSATLMLSGNAAAANRLLAGLTYTPTAEHEGCDTLHLSVTSSDGSNTYPTQATAATAITVAEDSEPLISGGPRVDPPTDSGTVTRGAIGEIAAASAATTDFANAGGTNTSLVLGNSQNFAGQIFGFTGDGTAGTLSAGQTFTRSPTKSAGGDGTFPMMTAGVWTYTPDNNRALNTHNTGDTLTDVNGNNWNDIVIGRFGANLLPDANENNIFVHSSVADSSAVQFDTIANFVSGTDKIDLTAFGAFDSAILALVPTTTSVPEHTIAWRFDSKANETIVYANPTDQTLSIGNSGLLEIHLQKIATLHSSDFTHASTTTASTVVAASEPIDLVATTHNDATIVTMDTVDVSSDATVSKDALSADWSAQTISIGDSFDATRDSIDSIDHAKFANFDEGPTFSTGNSVDDAVMTPPSGQSTEPPHVAVTTPMQTSFASDQKPVFDSAEALPIDHGAVMNRPTVESNASIVPSESDSKVDPETSLKNEDYQASIPKSVGPMDASGTPAHEIDTRPSDSDNVSIPSDADEDIIPMHGGGLHGFHFKDEISGLKGLSVFDVANLNDAPVSMSHREHAAAPLGPLAVSEGGETPGTLGDSFHFKSAISSSKGSGVMDVAELDHTPASSSHHEDVATTRVPLVISGGVQALELSLPGHGSADDFCIVPDHAKGHVVPHVQHDLIV